MNSNISPSCVLKSKRQHLEWSILGINATLHASVGNEHYAHTYECRSCEYRSHECRSLLELRNRCFVIVEAWLFECAERNGISSPITNLLRLNRKKWVGQIFFYYRYSALLILKLHYQRQKRFWEKKTHTKCSELDYWSKWADGGTCLCVCMCWKNSIFLYFLRPLLTYSHFRAEELSITLLLSTSSEPAPPWPPPSNHQKHFKNLLSSIECFHIIFIHIRTLTILIKKERIGRWQDQQHWYYFQATRKIK